MTSNNIDNITGEIKNTSDEQLKGITEEWYEKIHTQSMRVGAQFISAAVYGTMQKHLKKGAQSSLRDYRRMADEILDIISVQLKQDNTIQNDSEESNENQEDEV